MPRTPPENIRLDPATPPENFDVGETEESSGGVVGASWSLSLWRYFFVDYDGGSDANIGYIDAAAGTVFAPGAVAAVAIKTFTKLFEIIPLAGNCRNLAVLVKNRAAGACYLDADGTTESKVDWSGLSGYRVMLRRGSTDLTNSTTDRVLCGYIPALEGPNVDGSFTVLSGATTTTFSVTGTPFPAEPGIIAYRVRFTGNVTAGLANVCINIAANTTSQITTGGPITTPAVGNTFFIERPGTTVAKYIDMSNHGGYTGHSSNARTCAVRDVGFAIKTDIAGALEFIGGNSRSVSGFETTPEATAPTAGNVVGIEGVGTLLINNFYCDELDTQRNIGIGLRTKSGNVMRNVGYANIGAYGQVRAVPLNLNVFESINYGTIFAQGSYVQVDTRFRNLGKGAAFGNGLFLGSGATGTLKSRFIGGVSLESSSLECRGVEVQGSTTGIGISGYGVTISFENCSTGGTAPTQYGINASAAISCKLIFGRTTANTITGTLGDILVAGSAILTHAALTRTNVIDNVGNHFIGSAGEIVDQCALVTNQSGGALDIGDIVRFNGTASQVTSSQADAANTAAAAGVMVTAPASTAAGYAAVSGTPSVNFDGSPTGGAVAYLSPGTIRKATTTAPAVAGTNQKLRLGRAFAQSGTTARVTWRPEIVPVTADGNASTFSPEKNFVPRYTAGTARARL